MPSHTHAAPWTAVIQSLNQWPVSDSLAPTWLKPSDSLSIVLYCVVLNCLIYPTGADLPCNCSHVLRTCFALPCCSHAEHPCAPPASYLSRHPCPKHSSLLQWHAHLTKLQFPRHGASMFCTCRIALVPGWQAPRNHSNLAVCSCLLLENWTVPCRTASRIQGSSTAVHRMFVHEDRSSTGFTVLQQQGTRQAGVT